MKEIKKHNEPIEVIDETGIANTGPPPQIEGRDTDFVLVKKTEKRSFWDKISAAYLVILGSIFGKK